MEELVKAGIPIEGVLNGAADATVALAAAGGVALPKAAEISANAMNQFGLSARQMPKIADLIAGAANSSAIDVGEFGMSLAQVGAVANLAGASFRDTAVAIALMGNAGIKGSDAGTSLKTFLQNLNPVTKQQTELFRELGLVTANGANQFFDASGKLKSLGDVSQVLQNSLKGMTKQQKLATLEMLFGSDAIRAAAILSENGAKGFDKMGTAMGKISAADVAKTRLDNFSGAVEQLKGTLETLGITIGTIFLPYLKRAAQFLTALLARFLELPAGVQKAIVILGLVAIAVLGIISAATFLVAIAAPLGAVLGAIFSPVGAIVALVVVAIVALAAAFVLLYQRSQTVRDAVSSTFQAIKSVISEIVLPAVQRFVAFWKSTLQPMFAKAAADIKQKLEPAFKSIDEFMTSKVQPAITQVAAKLKEFQPTLEKIATFLAGATIAAWTALASVLGFIVPILLKIAGFVLPLMVTAFGFVLTAITTVIGWIQKIPAAFNSAKSGTTSFVASVVSVFSSIGATVVRFLQPVITFLQAWWGFAVSAWRLGFAVISAIVVVGWTLISTAFRNGLNIILFLLRPVMTLIVLAVRAALNTIVPIVTVGFNTMRAIIGVVLNVIKAVVTTVFGHVVNQIQRNLNIAKAIVSAVWSFILGRIKSAVSGIIAAMNGLSAMFGKVAGFFNQLKAAASGGVSGLVAFAGTIAGKVVSAIGNFGSRLFSIGADAMRGLLNGLSSMAGAVIGKAKSIANSVKDSIAGALHIGSPSRIMIGYGKNIVEGLMIGMEALQSPLTTTSLGVAATAASGPATAGSGGSTGVRGGNSTSQTFGPGVVIEKGAVQVTVPSPMSAAQAGEWTARKLATTLSTRTTAPRTSTVLVGG
jgi:TP901 family phage tail tape measure protein